MPEAGSQDVARDPREDAAAVPAPKARGGIFADPVVRTMAYAAVGIVVLFALTLASALATGVMGATGPRTRAEKEVAVSGAAVLQGSKDPAVWGEYISALVASGQYGRATDAIAQARASVTDSATAEFTLDEARLLEAKGDTKGAIAAADKAQKEIQAAQEALVASGGSNARTASIVGLPENYYAAALLKAYVYRDLGSFGDAVKQFDVYIDRNPGAADILVDRGNAKAKGGDKTGAEDDFRTALKFVPDDPEALAGLKTIGAVR